MLQVLWGICGMVVVLLLAWLLSVDRRRIRVRTVGLALVVQVVFAVLVLYVPAGQRVLSVLTSGVQAVIDSSAAGIDFLFGAILPDEGSVFAFQVLPVIVFFASLTAVLYHVGVLQLVTRWIGGGLARVLGTTGPESMNAAANIFVGQTEAPLVIRPYIRSMTPSEVFAVMCGGLTTVAGSVLIGYSLLGANLEYLIAASFMAAPAGLLMAKIIVPADALAELGTDATSAGGGGAQADGSAPSAGSEAQPGAGGRRATGERPAAGAPATAPANGAREPAARTGPASRASGGLAGRLAAAFRRGARRGATQDGMAELTRRANGGATAARRSGTAAAGGAPATSGTAGPDAPRKADAPDDPDADDERPVNVIDAASRGASDGLDLALNVGAMLLAFVSLIALANLVLGAVGGLFGYGDLSIEEILGYVFSPLMAAVGVPLHEAVDAGSFLGQKVVLNEFVAFADFAPQAEDYSVKTQAVVTFALTGFANLGSLAILLGGLGGIAPTQRGVIARLGLRAVAAGTLGNLMSAAIAGVLVG